MSEEIFVNTGTSFQQPYIARQPASGRTPAIGTVEARTPTNVQTPFTYSNRTPFTYRSPVSAQQPYIAQGRQPGTYARQGQTPLTYARQAQTPATYQARQPGTYARQGQTPLTYQHRTPSTYTRQGQLPSAYQARQPSTYTHANVSYQTPFTYARQGRTPFIGGAIRNEQVPYIANARVPFTYSARTPYIYTQADTYVNQFWGDADSYDSESSSILTLKVWMDNVAGVFPRDIRVSGELEVGGEDESLSYALNGTDVYTYDTYVGSYGTDPSALVYHIDDILVDGYTVRRTQSFTGDSLSAVTPSGCSTLTTTAQSIFYSTGSNSGKRGVQYVAIAFNNSVSGTLTGSLIFEKSGSTTYTYSYTYEYDVVGEEDDCPQCCIHEDMLITTPEGNKHIDDISIDDVIYGYNFETNQKEKTTISSIKILKRDKIVTVNDTIVTDDHPIFLIDGSLASTNPEATLKNYHKEVNRLEVGDKILDVNNNHIVVNSIEPYAGKHRVYTIKTELDNFYADDILVDSVLRENYKTEVKGQWSQS
jgi:hypothetical protein